MTDNFYSNIRSFRRIRGMDEDTLARAMGYDSSMHITMLENGEIDPYYSEMCKLASILDVPTSALFSVSDPDYFSIYLNFSEEKKNFIRMQILFAEKYWDIEIPDYLK